MDTTVRDNLIFIAIGILGCISIALTPSCQRRYAEVIDTRGTAAAPVIELSIASSRSAAAKEEMTAVYEADWEEDYLVNVSIEKNGCSAELRTCNESIASVERMGSGSGWLVSANAPGETELVLSITDPEGHIFEYTYTFVVFGHIRLDAVWDQPFGFAGFEVSQYELAETLQADMYISCKLTGWASGDSLNVETIEVEPFNGKIDIDSNTSYPCIIDLDEARQSIWKFKSSDGIPYSERALDMRFIVSLSDPYIVIDGVRADDDLKEPVAYGCTTTATLQQEGIIEHAEKGETVPGVWVNKPQ